MLPTTTITARRATPSRGRHPRIQAGPGMGGVYRGPYAEARGLRGPCGEDLMSPNLGAAQSAGLPHQASATPKTGRRPTLVDRSPRSGAPVDTGVRTKITVYGLWNEPANR